MCFAPLTLFLMPKAQGALEGKLLYLGRVLLLHYKDKELFHLPAPLAVEPSCVTGYGCHSSG